MLAQCNAPLDRNEAVGAVEVSSAACSHDEGRADEALFFVQRASVAKVVAPQSECGGAQSLKAPMYGF